MSTRFEKVDPTSIAFVNELDLAVENDIEDPQDQDVLVLWYDEAIIIPGGRDAQLDLANRIIATVYGHERAVRIVDYFSAVIIDDPQSGSVMETQAFSTSGEAWQWLADERRAHEDESNPPNRYDNPYSETVDELDARAAAKADPGTITGSTPGYTGDGGDTGFLYRVVSHGEE